MQVHNLEHGFALVQYSSIDPVFVSQLTAVVQATPGYPDYVIVAPYPGMSKLISLTAWRTIKTLDILDEAEIRAFLAAYRARITEPGAAAC